VGSDVTGDGALELAVVSDIGDQCCREPSFQKILDLAFGEYRLELRLTHFKDCPREQCGPFPAHCRYHFGIMYL
jgi:hypothetical protein